VLVKVGRLSRPLMPPGGLAQCSVGSTANRCGRKRPVLVTNWFIQVTRTGRFTCASIVCDGQWNDAPSLALP
jgi:hypothetical protein